MPYVRKYRRIRKGRRVNRGPWYNRKYTPLGLAKKALAGVWKLKGLVNSEKYKLDTSGFINPTTGGLVTLLSGVAVGDADNNRSGNSIYARSLHGNLFITHNASGSSSQLLRISIIIDTQQVSDTVPGFTTVYENNGVLGHLNSETVGRFKVLYSRVHRVDSDDASKSIQINLPMRHHIRFNGTGTSDVQKGALYMVTSSTEAVNAPKLDYEFRLSYHDN